MEPMALLTFALAVLVFLGLAATTGYRRGSKRINISNTQIVPTIMVVRDADVARRMIIDHADSFSGHPAVTFPVDLDAGHRKTTSINRTPYGPLWRVLRRNLTAGVLHPSRLARLAQLQRDAAEALIADLHSALRGADAGGGEAAVVAVRDALYDAVFDVTARMCFGDGAVSGRDLRAMRRTLFEFFHSGIDARLLASSRIERLLRWRVEAVEIPCWHAWRGRLAKVFVPAIEARRRSRRSNGSGGGGSSSYVDSLLDLHIPDDNVEPAGGKSLDNAADARRTLKDDEIVRLVWEFLGAGTETVVACIEWTLACLVAQPEVQKRLQSVVGGEDHQHGQLSDERLRDLPYLRAVILESLWLHPPVPFILRDVVGSEGTDDVGGTTLPPDDGSLVRFMFVAEDIGRGKAWTDPEEFRPEQFLAGGEGENVMGPVPGHKQEIKQDDAIRSRAEALPRFRPGGASRWVLNSWPHWCASSNWRRRLMVPALT